MIKKILKILLALFIILVLYFLFWPVGFEPVAYTPPPNPGLRGVFQKNNKLEATEKILNGKGRGPEDITMGPDSMLYTGFEDGNILKFSLDGKESTHFANTGGRPLGMKFDAAGNLIVADAYKGLLAIDTLGKVTVLADEVDGTKIFYADDLDITQDGIIYFSDATQRNRDIIVEVWELQPTGRLLSYDPKTKMTKVEMENMRFANGVAIGPNDEYLLITETFGMVINKFWLKGAKKGQKEIWVNELPGYPDNITFNGSNMFWLAIPDRRVNPEFEAVYEKPFLRKVIARLPESLTAVKEPAPFGMVIGLDLNGNVMHSFQDSTGGIHSITSVNEYNRMLYIGSLRMENAGIYKPAL